MLHFVLEIILGVVAFVFFIRIMPTIILIYEKNSEKLIDFFLKLFTLCNNKVISIKDWKKIKQKDKGFFLDLISNFSEQQCYYYSLELALILKDVNLVWSSITDPIDLNCYAHAFIEKNGYVYDSNARISYKGVKKTMLPHINIFESLKRRLHKFEVFFVTLFFQFLCKHFIKHLRISLTFSFFHSLSN